MNDWKKFPSVTVGGKAYFWFSPSRKEWVMWDRQAKSWTRRSENVTLGYYSSAAIARAS